MAQSPDTPDTKPATQAVPPATDTQRTSLARAVSERVKDANKAQKAALDQLRKKHNPSRPR